MSVRSAELHFPAAALWTLLRMRLEAVSEALSSLWMKAMMLQGSQRTAGRNPIRYQAGFLSQTVPMWDRATVSVEPLVFPVTVENGAITDITINSYADDGAYFTCAQDTVISEIISTQSLDVQAVSGATFSSNSIMEAVADALGASSDREEQTKGGESGSGRGGGNGPGSGQHGAGGHGKGGHGGSGRGGRGGRQNGRRKF